MNPADAALLASLPDLAFQAVLLFARIGASVMLLPGLGEAEVPAPIRVALGALLVPLMLPVIGPGLPPQPEAPAAAFALLAIEVAVGLWLGTLARILVMALAMAGQAIAALTGLAGMLVGDAGLGLQATALGRAFGLLAAVLVLATGLHGVALTAMVESYTVLPVGGFPAGAAAESVAAAGAASLGLALQLAAPFVVGAVLLNMALGLLSRLAPQVQTFFVAVPGQILAGLGLLMLLATPLLALFAATLAAGFATLPGAR
jgi:flagellar biosynthetic protein FliR